MGEHRIYKMGFNSIYPHYVTKAEKKNRTEKEVLEIIEWLTGYNKSAVNEINKNGITVREFFDEAPKMNPNRELIKGVVCGIRVENVEEPLMKNIRYLDKLIDELAKGKSMEKILRK